jgi:hypothetical protein
MGAEEACATGDQSALWSHAFLTAFLATLAGTPWGWEAARPTL